jgi:ACS family hexuronate transporter-like MFS transporter
LIKRGWSAGRARKTVIAVASLLMPAGILAAFVEDPLVALALIGVVLFGFQVWINNVQTVASDFFPDRAVASVAGLGGTGAGNESMIFIFTTGWMVDHFFVRACSGRRRFVGANRNGCVVYASWKD